MTLRKIRGDGRRRARNWGGLILLKGLRPLLFLFVLFSASVHAQSLGITSQGSTGGLVIPSAEVLPTGTVALTYGNYEEPQLGVNSTHQDASFGVGLLNHVELFGRVTNYTNPIPGSIFAKGTRDLSANVKLQLPTPWTLGPKLAVGLNDFAGGAANFKSRYLVATSHYGPFSVSLGYAQGAAHGHPPTFDGAFSGLEWRLGNSGASLLAESDGKQNHAGLRWHSPPLAALGRAQLVGSLQRSFNAVTPTGSNADATNFALSLVIPLGDAANARAQAEECAPDPRRQELPAIDAKPEPGTLPPTPEDRLLALRKALIAVGLERVRVGTIKAQWGTSVVVEYENHRYAQNEVDAIGLVLGLGAEMAPPGTQRVHAITLKDGLRLYETSVGVTVFREFLRGGPASAVANSLIWERRPPDWSAQTHWIDAEPTSFSRVRIEIKPNLNYALATEVGAFDYSLAANVQAMAPLWTGGQLYTSYMVPMGNSRNMDANGVFASSRQQSGLKTAALQQSFWWWNRRVLANVAAGRFYYDTPGVQGEAAVFVPSSDDMLRLRGAAYTRAPGGLAGGERTLAASYRHMLTPTMWLEGGEQHYSDGSTGPSVEWKRWFGDVSVGLFFRKGGANRFAGMQMSFPLTPRQGMEPGPVILTGPSQFSQDIRTQLTSAGQSRNLVQPGAVRDLSLDTSLDVDLLNAGRISQDYLVGQLYRMKDAFFAYRNNSD